MPHLEFSNLTIIERIKTEPKISVNVISDPFVGISTPEFEINDDLKGFWTGYKNSTLYGTLIDYKVYNEVKSMHLGNSLKSAISSLNIKPIVENVPDLNQNFFSFNELPWNCLCRLMSYLSPELYWLCDYKSIRVFEVPTKFNEFTENSYSTISTYSRFYIDNLISDSKYNPGYHSINTVPINKLAYDKALFSNDMINNYMNNYIHRDSIYKHSATLTTPTVYTIGEGISIKGVNFMVVSRISTFDKNFNILSNMYGLIGV